MKTFLYNRWTMLVLRVFIGGIFVYAGILKLADPIAFSDSIASFQLLPKEVINLLSMGLPPVEILAGGMMITGWRHTSGTLCILLLTVVFALALLLALVRGLEVDCGCFGEGKPSEFKTWLSLARDALLMVGSAFVYSASLRSTSKITT